MDLRPLHHYLGLNYEESTNALDEWFGTALFWRPQVALLVNTRTFLPVFLELAPAATLLDRVPAAIASALRLHGVDETFIAGELAAMDGARIAPTNDRSVLGVMNEYVFLGEAHRDGGLTDLDALTLRLAGTPIGPLHGRTGFPDRELHAVIGHGFTPNRPQAPPANNADDPGLARVIPFPGTAAKAPAAPARRAGRPSTYQLKVTLLGTSPPIWRRVLVDGAATLDAVHEVFQAAFGWWNYHLHEFEFGRDRYGVPDPDWDFGPPAHDERTVRLDRVAKEGTSFTYVYDFGDYWKHKVVVEKVLPADPARTVPACIDGRRACPPEDCGGTGGYRTLVEILADPSHPEHAERREWHGGDFDPDAFDPGAFEDNLRMGRLAAFDDDDDDL